MKVLPFTIPVAHDKTVIVLDEVLPHFYPHLHRHEEVQLTFVLRGEGTLLVGSHMHAFCANEIYLIGANMPHVFKSDASYFDESRNQTIHSLTLFFNTGGNLAPLFDLPELKGVHSFFGSYYSGFKVPASAFGAIAGRVLGLRNAGGLDRLLQFFDLLKALSELDHLVPLSSDVQAGSLSESEGARIGNIYHYILQHYSRELTLEEVAAAAFMTPQTFCRYFKKRTRMTFVSFLNEVRINEACKMLVGGDYDSVASVAYACGFNSITNFNRVFKSTLGISPREYQSRYLCKVR
ncbi:AraC family transcriptional regulator [Paraflavisolibacter sp. H34]|uniref:AraC family transcriptional regulator n=1 Tax=Huijunlia imazamoxiresistens TaxID=3127457 RepID=UPI0030199EF3